MADYVQDIINRIRSTRNTSIPQRQRRTASDYLYNYGSSRYFLIHPPDIKAPPKPEESGDGAANFWNRVVQPMVDTDAQTSMQYNPQFAQEAYMGNILDRLQSEEGLSQDLYQRMPEQMKKQIEPYLTYRRRGFADVPVTKVEEYSDAETIKKESVIGLERVKQLPPSVGTILSQDLREIAMQSENPVIQFASTPIVGDLSPGDLTAIAAIAYTGYQGGKYLWDKYLAFSNTPEYNALQQEVKRLSTQGGMSTRAIKATEDYKTVEKTLKYAFNFRKAGAVELADEIVDRYWNTLLKTETPTITAQPLQLGTRPIPTATQTGAMKMGGRQAMTPEIWNSMSIQLKEAATNLAKLPSSVAGKTFELLTDSEIVKLSQVVSEQPIPPLEQPPVSEEIMARQSTAPIDISSGTAEITNEQYMRLQELGYPDEIIDGFTPDEVQDALRREYSFGKNLEAAIEQPTTPTEAQVTLPVEPPEPPKVIENVFDEVPVPEEGIRRIPDFQNVDDIVNYMTRPDIWRTLSNLPGIKQVMGQIQPGAVAQTIPEKARLARAMLLDASDQLTATVLSHVQKLGELKYVFGDTDDKGIIKSGSLKGKLLGDVIEFPDKYSLTDKQKDYLAKAREIESGIRDFLLRNEIEIGEAKMLTGQKYAGRVTVGKVDQSGELLDIGYVQSGARMGKKIGAEKERIFTTMKEAVDAGYRYLPYDQSLNARLSAALRRVANKKVADWVLEQVPYRTTAADPEIALAAEQAKRAYDVSKKALAAFNRAVRGEAVPQSTIKSIERYYPEQAKWVQEIVDSTDKYKTAKQYRNPLKALVEGEKGLYLRARELRIKSRERNMVAHIGEGQTSIPAFSGKIFTGEEASELAAQLNQLLAPENTAGVLRALQSATHLSRFVTLAGDFSVMFIQLLLNLGHPVKYGKSAAGLINGFTDALANQRIMQAYVDANQEVFEFYPNLINPLGGSNQWTEAFNKGGILGEGKVIRPKSEESFVAAVARTPFRALRKGVREVLHPFESAIRGALTVAQVEMAKSYMNLVKTPSDAADIAQVVNAQNGLTSTKRLGVTSNMRALEDVTFLAGRYNRAVAGTLFDAARGATFTGGVRGRIAIVNLTRGIAAVAALAYAISLAKGESPEEATKHLDPTSPDFMTWTFGDTRLGLGSKYRSVLRLTGQMAENPQDIVEGGMENPVFRWLRGNLAPVPSTAIDIVTGKNYLGEPTTDNIYDFSKNVLGESFIPIWIQSTLDEGSPQDRLVRGAAEFVGGRAYPDSYWSEVKELRKKYANIMFKKEWEELASKEKEEVRRKYAVLAAMEEKAELESAKYDSEFDVWRNTMIERSTEERNESLDQYAEALLTGYISKYEYDKARSRIRAYYSGAQGVIWTAGELLDPKGEKEYKKWIEENQNPKDKAMDDYYSYQSQLIDEADLPVDWDVIQSKLDSFLADYPSDVENYVRSHLNDWIEDLPDAARQVEQRRAIEITFGNWWDDYRKSGFSQSKQESNIVRPGTAGDFINRYK